MNKVVNVSCLIAGLVIGSSVTMLLRSALGTKAELDPTRTDIKIINRLFPALDVFVARETFNNPLSSGMTYTSYWTIHKELPFTLAADRWSTTTRQEVSALDQPAWMSKAATHEQQVYTSSFSNLHSVHKAASFALKAQDAADGLPRWHVFTTINPALE